MAVRLKIIVENRFVVWERNQPTQNWPGKTAGTQKAALQREFPAVKKQGVSISVFSIGSPACAPQIHLDISTFQLF